MATVCKYAHLQACSPTSQLEEGAPTLCEVHSSPPHPSGSAPGEAEAPSACSSGVISGSAPWIFLHGFFATLLGSSKAIGTLLPFPSADKPTAFDATAFDALLPGEQRRYVDILAKRKRKKCRQKGVKKVNKIGLFTLLLVVGNVVLAMLAQSASNGGARSNSNAHSAVDANATTLCEPETEVSSDSGFFTTIHVKLLSNSSPAPHLILLSRTFQLFQMDSSVTIDMARQDSVCGVFNMSNTTVEEEGSRFSATLPRPDANPKSPETPAHLPGPSSTKKVLHALGSFVPCVFFSGLAGGLSFTATSAKMRVGTKTFSRLFFPLLFASNIALAGAGGATPAREAERGVGLALRGPDEGGGWGLRKLTTFPVSGQDGLYNKISHNGNAEMSNGDEVVASEGVYQCGTCYGSSLMYGINDFNGVIRCENDNLQCKLDGEGSRSVMSVDGTGGGTLSLRGFHIRRGSYSWAGGIFVYDGSINLSIMKFTECQATSSSSDDGGGAIYARAGTINLYAVEFSGNSAASNKGDDIYTVDAAVTVHSNCPDGYDGSPTVGENQPRPFAPRHFPTNLSPHPFPFASSHHPLRSCP